MIVQVGENKYQIGFQYSDPQIEVNESTGRPKFINNANRVTICKFRQIEPFETEPTLAEAKVDKRGLDQFDRKKGRRLALDRVLHKAGVLIEEQHKIKHEIFKKMKHGEN